MSERKQKNGLWKRTGRRLVFFIGFLLLLLAALWMALPFVLSWIPFPMMTFRLLDEDAKKLPASVVNRAVTVRPVFSRGWRFGSLGVTLSGEILDWPYTVRANIRCLVPWKGAVGFELVLDGTEWRVYGNFRGGIREWKADAVLAAPPLSESDPLLSSLIAKFAPPTVSNLIVSGSIDASVSAEKTRKIPVTAWTAKGRMKDICASCEFAGKPVAVRKFGTSFGADGIADRKTIRPMNPHIAYAEYNGISVTNVSASIRMTETSLLVTEAGAGFCGGEVKLYSLFLNPASLTTGFTLFLDDIDTNEIVTHLKGFKGDATGRLHGKIPVFLKNGRELRLKNSYLYSIPGETGTIRFEDAQPILDNLALGGVDEATTSNLAKALTNLDYSSLKFELKRESDGEGLALGMSIEGSATYGTTTVPVSFAVTLHGDLEQLVNTGLKMK